MHSTNPFVFAPSLVSLNLFSNMKLASASFHFLCEKFSVSCLFTNQRYISTSKINFVFLYCCIICIKLNEFFVFVSACFTTFKFKIAFSNAESRASQEFCGRNAFKVFPMLQVLFYIRMFPLQVVPLDDKLLSESSRGNIFFHNWMKLRKIDIIIFSDEKWWRIHERIIEIYELSAIRWDFSCLPLITFWEMLSGD